MRRRDFIALAGGAATVPFVAHAQSANQTRRIGALMNYAEGDEEGAARIEAFRKGLAQRGWREGENLRIEVRWAAGRDERVKSDAAGLGALKLDAIVVNSTPAVAALQQAAPTTPIVFVQVSDAVGSGFVSSMAHPGGHITGFADFEPAIAGKWVELIKELAPTIGKAAVLLHPETKNQLPFLQVAEAAAAHARVRVSAIGVHNRDEIERSIAELGHEGGVGLIVLPTPVNNNLRGTIIKATAQFRIPAIYPYRYYFADGGLVAYGVDQVDQWREAALYIDRILHGEKPGELPVQAPTNFKLWINQKTARALNLAMPPSLLARADEVIE